MARPNNSFSLEEDLLGADAPTLSSPCGNGTSSAMLPDARLLIADVDGHQKVMGTPSLEDGTVTVIPLRGRLSAKRP
jgi:hypothetical protein